MPDLDRSLGARKPPLVDVIVPAYNAEKTVERALRSVLSQRLDRFHLVVVDDGSSDATAAIAESIDDDRLTVLRENHRGVGAARNAGVAAGAAPAVAFLDADDAVCANWLESLLQRADIAFARCGYLMVEPAGSERTVGVDGPLLAGSFVVRRDLFEAVGGYDERLRYSENTDLWLRLELEIEQRSEASHYVDRPLLIVHRDADIRSQKFGHTALRDAAELILIKHGTRLSNEAIASFSAVAGVNSLELGDRRRAQSHLRRAIHNAPRRWRYWLRLAQSYVPPRPWWLGRWDFLPPAADERLQSHSHRVEEVDH